MMIDTLEAIQAGSTTQWIRIRGADTSNPVLLLIQQGPGLPMINEARRLGHLLGLEQAFTVIYWDQRGCGRSRSVPGAFSPAAAFGADLALTLPDTVRIDTIPAQAPARGPLEQSHLDHMPPKAMNA